MKKKRIWKVILLCVLGTLLLAVLLQIGWSGKYTGSDGKYLPITASDSWAHIYKPSRLGGNRQGDVLHLG